MKKSELVALCEENGLEHKGIKNDDLRAKLASHFEATASACDTCVYIRFDARLGDYNMPGLPDDTNDICRYYRSIIYVRPKLCDGHLEPGIGKTTDAKINERKRSTVFDS